MKRSEVGAALYGVLDGLTVDGVGIGLHRARGTGIASGDCPAIVLRRAAESRKEGLPDRTLFLPLEIYTHAATGEEAERQADAAEAAVEDRMKGDRHLGGLLARPLRIERTDWEPDEVDGDVLRTTLSVVAEYREE